ncbi:hypothetical protein bcCo53_001038 (plasmid) [Borrelia coriaceae]|uniref:Uncharacterized protein n=1 Tax=Borrelia coriaceae ATCC 43381 TaxID=1408429 RepID=W5SWX5_9SPIR|nr:hypothetical protein [Borrelia coriaceae]AHH11400.1 hypothetical protein BCO_0007900 [Borrelia coriaceae ATCC 43381]AHH11891.1 hypothetical protein BCO_0007903 [Borrelia coriaceae ATCC 43381]UPA16700.1 hypothetical protein bcCo53_000864 [Borrelia coriaceae]UPA16742.1 hypothetical protein bcCo53_000906 [Borrelia coriaceae]UPA16785.1 hypothetical protein bcCo53_000949 [Borrelia coriaceae]
MNDTNINNLTQLLLGIDGNKLLVISGLILGLAFLLKPVLKDILNILLDKFKTQCKQKDKDEKEGL